LRTSHQPRCHHGDENQFFHSKFLKYAAGTKPAASGIRRW
jgi:hypothetical protein